MIYNYGDELKPASDPVVRYGGTQLVFDKDISVTYTNNVNVGTAKRPSTVWEITAEVLLRNIK